MQTKCLVIVPSKDHFDYVLRTVVSVANAKAAVPTDYVIVDDASEGWEGIEWSEYPASPVPPIRFTKGHGLTRSWNAGLKVARELGYEYAVCANSDLVFSSRWQASMLAALEECDLAGPLTNAPGHCPWQDVRPFIASDHQTSCLSDAMDNIDEVQRKLECQAVAPICCSLNGFCLMARTAVWWGGAWNGDAVFNPRFRLEYNETELQKRWCASGRIIKMVPTSYVFHFRSVSRPAGLNGSIGYGALRCI